MSWTSKIVSGQYITDYYSNGTKRFLPVLNKNSSGELIATLSGAGTFTLASDAIASAYNDYEVIYNPDTGLATFTFNDEVITSTWEGEASSQNMVVWGAYFGESDRSFRFYPITFSSSFSSLPVLP